MSVVERVQLFWGVCTRQFIALLYPSIAVHFHQVLGFWRDSFRSSEVWGVTLGVFVQAKGNEG